MRGPNPPISGIKVEIPGKPALLLTDLLVDFSGTLALDGLVLPQVPEALVSLSTILRITVATADTFGRASEALAGLPVDIRIVENGEQKAEIVRALGAERVVAVGNGRNDVAMCQAAALAMAVIGPEGVSAELLAVADVITPDIYAAMDLLLHPRRLKATLRA